MPVEFDDDELEQVICTQLQVADWRTPHRSSIRKDVRALLRTYTPADRSARTGIDDILDCPLRELRLLGHSEATERYRFATGAKPSLPAAVVAFAAMDYVDRTAPETRTVTLSHLAQESGGPGKAFRLTEGDLREAMGAVAAESARIDLVNVAGVSQLTWCGSPRSTAFAVLDDYYGRSIDRSRAAGEMPA